MEYWSLFKMFYILILFSLVFSNSLDAAPPIDLSDFNGRQQSVRKQVPNLSDKDLIFTDNIIKPEKTIRGLVLFKKQAIGRSHPNFVEGKPLMRFREEYRARFLQYSQDKKWIAVELLNGSRKAWIPSESVEILDEEYVQSLEKKSKKRK